MEKKSRVKKYEALRNEIESTCDIEQTNSTTEDVLRAFDSTVFKKAVVVEESDPKHAKVEDVQTSLQDSFTNEYLDDFMREVREYNMRKGTRSIDSTEFDILTKISTLPNRTQNNVVTYVEEEYEPRPDDDFRSKKDIVKEVEALFQQTLTEEVDIVVENFAENTDEELVEETFAESDNVDAEEEKEVLMIAETVKNIEELSKPVIQQPVIKEVKTQVEKPQVKRTQVKKEENPSSNVHEELVEETKRLKKSLATYEAELNDLSSGVEKNNRLLNISLGVLIVALLVIIGFIVYTIYQAGGFGL